MTKINNFVPESSMSKDIIEIVELSSIVTRVKHRIIEFARTCHRTDEHITRAPHTYLYIRHHTHFARANSHA